MSKIPELGRGNFLMTLFNEGKQVRTTYNRCWGVASILSGFQDGSSLSNNHYQPVKGDVSFPLSGRLSPSWSSVPPFNRSLVHRWNRYLELPYRTSPARGCSKIRRLTYPFEFQPEGARLLSVPSLLAKNASLSSSPEGNLRQSMSRMSSVAEDELVALPGPLRAT